MKLTNEQIEEIYQSFDCLIPKSLIKKVLKKVLDCVNKIDGNYLKISDEALEFLGGIR